MKNLLSIITILITLSVLAYGLPSEPQKSEVCQEGESLNEIGVCVKSAVENPPKKVKSTKKKQIKKKLDEEIRDIKRIVLEGLDQGVVKITCPDGKELNEQGLCDEPLSETQLETKPKTKKQLALEKKLERELERVLKKEIQNGLRKKQRRQQKKEMKAKKTAAEASASEKSLLDKKDVELPFCAENGPSDAKDCRPRP